jgi:hypothetical protein
LYLMFVLTEYISRAIMYCYWRSLQFSALLVASWVMSDPNMWWAWTNLTIQIVEEVGLWISWFFRWKSKICSLGILCNTMLFVVQSQSFCFVSYPTTTDRCMHSLRFSLIVSPGLNSRFLILFTLTWIFTSYIWNAMFRCCHWSVFRCELLTSSSIFDIPMDDTNL